MKQLVQPNIEIVEKAGWCLSYARRAFGADAVEPSAYVAWQNTKYKHLDRNFPQGVSFPVWFEWWGDLGSGRQRYDHVAVYHTDGKVWSSPLAGTGRAWFATIDDLVRAFGGGMKYLGWSEDISNVRVIKEEGMTTEEARNIANGWKIPMRVLNSEAKGWDRTKTHKGEYDNREVDYMTALILKHGQYGAMTAYAQQAWNEGGAYRTNKDTWKKAASELETMKKNMPMEKSDAEKRLRQIKDALDI